MAEVPVMFMQLTQSQYNGLSSKDSGTLYFCTDTQKIYLGSKYYGGKDVAKLTIKNGSTTLEYDGTADKSITIPSVTVDTALSSTSTNPVQNKVVNSALAGKLSTSGGTVSGTLTAKRIVTQNVGNTTVPTAMPSGTNYTGTVNINPLMPTNSADTRDVTKPVIEATKTYTATTSTSNGQITLNGNVTINQGQKDDGTIAKAYQLTGTTYGEDNATDIQHKFLGTVNVPDLNASSITINDNIVNDFVIEQGTSDNWEYIKYANGFAICAGVWTFTSAAIATAWGALYKDDGTTVPAKPYPFTFVSVPAETANIQGNGNSLWITGTLKNTTSQTMSYIIARPTAKTVSGSVIISVIGRWK